MGLTRSREAAENVPRKRIEKAASVAAMLHYVKVPVTCLSRKEVAFFVGDDDEQDRAATGSAVDNCSCLIGVY
jgi:hypothetical protein